MATILNVLSKIPEYVKHVTITPEQAAHGELPGAPAKRQRAKPVEQDPEANWRQELFELELRFHKDKGNLPSTEAAEQRLSALEAEVKAAAAELETAINAAKSALKTPFLSALESTHLRGQVDSLNERLADLHKNTRCKLAASKALVEACKTWNPLRGRFLELQKRQAAIDKATIDKATRV